MSNRRKYVASVGHHIFDISYRSFPFYGTAEFYRTRVISVLWNSRVISVLLNEPSSIEQESFPFYGTAEFYRTRVIYLPVVVSSKILGFENSRSRCHRDY